VEYALSAIAGHLSETDKSRLDAFSERQNNVVSDILIFFISQLIDTADRKLFKQIQLSHHCFNSFFQALAFLNYSRYSLGCREHQLSLPQLNTVLYKNMFVNYANWQRGKNQALLHCFCVATRRRA